MEVQERNRHSLLWWMRQLIALRKRWKAFGLGTLEFLSPDNRKMLAYVRRYQEEYSGGGQSFPVRPAGELDLSPFNRACRWSCLAALIFRQSRTSLLSDARPARILLVFAGGQSPGAGGVGGRSRRPQVRAVLQAESDWEEVLQGKSGRLETALQSWLPSRRWFGGKARTIKAVNILEQITIPTERGESVSCFSCRSNTSKPRRKFTRFLWRARWVKKPTRLPRLAAAGAGALVGETDQSGRGHLRCHCQQEFLPRAAGVDFNPPPTARP